MQVLADPLHLPFADKSVDVCLLAHTLPWCTDPHRLLREADRVLIDDGWLVISGFNPLSLMGLRKLVPVLRKTPPYNSRMFTLMRQLDWLSLLNFEVLHYSRFHVLPRKSRRAALNTHIPALGCLQLIVARKRTIPLTLNPLRHNKSKTLSARPLAPPGNIANRMAKLPPGSHYLPAWDSLRGARQFITTLVFGMACMAFDPYPFDLMLT